QLRAESGDAAVLHEDGAVEGFALDRDDMGMGDGGDRHAMTFRRGRGGVKSGAHGVRRRRPGPGPDYSANMSKQTTTEKQTAATTEKAEAPQKAAAATTKADKAKKAEKRKKAKKAEKAENPKKPKKAEKPKKTETPNEAAKAAKRAKRPAVTAPADPRPVGFRLESGWSGQVTDLDPRATPGFTGSKSDGKALLAARAAALDELQERLYAAHHGTGEGRSVLLVVQGMDTSGKGGIMRHVVGSVDPQGVGITAFKAPTDEEREHDFLWRIRPHAPAPGMIGVFDRSQYEDVLIHRVHGWADAQEIRSRYAAINAFERELVAAGTTVVKVMLHVSYEEQGSRLMERLERPDKHWKHDPGDIDERLLWDDYMEAYTRALRATATVDAPWHVIPADRKWYARIAVQQLLIDALTDIDPQWPT